MEPEKQIKLVYDLLSILQDRSEYQWRHEEKKGNQDLHDLWEECREEVWGLTPETLEESAKDWLDTRRVRVRTSEPLYLPPLPGEQNFIAALILDWDFNEEPEGAQSLRLQMIRRNEDTQARDKHPFQTLCVHFDGANPGKGWMYFHSQLAQRFTGDFDWAYHRDPGWLPKELPRVPLPVRQPVELLHCAVMSTYGTNPDVFGRLQRQIDGVGRKQALPLLGHVLKEAEKLESMARA